MRTCDICGERKTFSRFRKDKDRPSGRSRVCRVCENEAKANMKSAEDEGTDADVH